MSKQRRWFCRECKREWLDPKVSNDTGGSYANSQPVSITGNPFNNLNCQVCGSPEIELIEYTPPHPGLDIPREGESTITRIPVEVVSRVPGLTSHQESSLSVYGEKESPSLMSHLKPSEIDRLNAASATIEANPGVILLKEEECPSIYDLSDMD